MDSSAQGAVIAYEIVEDGNCQIVDAKLSGGHEYKGPISMDGKGYYKWNDGTSYDGDFQNGEMTGFGVYNFKNGIYSGHIYGGIRHGFGTLVLHDTNTKYIGEWNNGKRDGKGVIYYDCDNNKENEENEENKAYFDGDWINGERSGNGRCRYKNGDTYDGEWNNDDKNGQGIMKWKSLNEIYYGEWKNNEPHGNGIHLMCNNDINIDMITIEQLEGEHNFTTLNDLNWYYGEWKNGKRDGYGIYHYSNGSQYKGEWMKNKKHGKGEYIYENGTKFIGEFENDQQKYESKQHNQLIQKQIAQHFVINIDENTFDINLINKIILRHWKSIQNIFQNLCILNKLWMLIELINLKETHQIYDINKKIVLYSVYQNKECNITDPNYRFLFRQFHQILLRLSMFSKQNLEDFLLNVIEISPNLTDISLNDFFWDQLSSPYHQLWSNQDAKLLFEQKYEAIINDIGSNEDIDDNVYAMYIDGIELKKILKQIVAEPMLQSVIMKQFENCYYSKQSQPLMLQQYDIDFKLDSNKFLVYECKLFFVLLICIKISFDEMILEKEREKKEKEQQEMEEKAKQKGKKSKKDNKKKKKEEEQQENIEEEKEEEKIQELKLINVSPKHIQDIYNQIKIV